jgi:hypothetical protein
MIHFTCKGVHHGAIKMVRFVRESGRTGEEVGLKLDVGVEIVDPQGAVADGVGLGVDDAAAVGAGDNVDGEVPLVTFGDFVWDGVWV